MLGFSAAAALSSFYMGREFMKRMTGASSVGMMLFMTLVSLVSMFNDSDRGKAVITDLYHQRLPYSYITGISGGSTEYRTAVFFWKFILLGIITIISFVLYIRNKSALMTYDIVGKYIGMTAQKRIAFGIFYCFNSVFFTDSVTDIAKQNMRAPCKECDRHGAKRDLSLSQIEKMTFFFNFIDRWLQKSRLSHIIN